MAKDLPSLTLAGRKKPVKLPLPARGRGFALERRGTLTLVRPDGKRDWDDGERVFRSLVFDRDGRPVSVGLPKFFSPFSDQRTVAAIDAALAAGEEVRLWRKEDGALMIRSVHRGQPYWRTRGAFDLEGYEAPLTRLVTERYPCLLDPAFAAGLSLQLEFVSPTTRVVVHYPADDLILIGATDNATLQMLEPDEVDQLAVAAGLRRPESRPARELGSDVRAIQAVVDEDVEHEGWVVRHGELLLRVKSARYLAAFRRRFELNPERVFAALERKGSPEAAFKHLGVQAGDALSGYLDEVCAAYARLDETTAVTLSRLEGLLAEHAGLSRAKLWERVGSELAEPEGAALMHLRAGERPQAERLVKEALRRRAARTLAG